MKAKRVIFILDILNLTCFWNICQPLDVTGRNVISGGKGSQTDVVREVAAELKGTVQGGCHIYLVMGDKPYKIKVMAL